jgi:ABC-type multidrug transport system ATPase subunit
VSVLLASHVLAELERVTDHYVLISIGRVGDNGTGEHLLGGQRLRLGPTQR